ncbi:neocarzinostatin apoprotein domain-containing protein [Streptomyces daliensis]
MIRGDGTDLRRHRRGGGVRALVLTVCALMVGAGLAVPAAASSPSAVAADEGKPSLSLSTKEAGTGGSVTVTGKGWRPKALLTLLMCGQNAIGGTNACANSEGRAVTTSADGTFEKKIPVAEPPKPCPCVVRAATVTGSYASADAAFEVAGHPVKPLPEDAGGGRLTVLAARLEGGGGLLDWFGAPPQGQLVLTVGNLGADRAENPVFEVGTSHGVYAPEWERHQWRGTVDPGKKKRVILPVELSSGAHGDYTVAAKYGGKVLTEQPWDVGRPWGVTLFWILLFLVVPAAVFRVGMAVVDRTRPRQSGQVVSPAGAHAKARAVPLRDRLAARLAERLAKPPAPAAGPPGERAEERTLPWFTPDTLAPRTRRDPQFSAPSDDRPPPKGST